MKYIFSDLRTNRYWAWLGLLICIISSCALFFSSELDGLEKIGWASLAYSGLSIFLIPSLYRAAQLGHEHVLTVSIWSGTLVLVGVIFFYFAFFNWPGSTQPGVEKILNLAPVIVAAWAAGIGWFLHYQMTAKTNRTKHALDIVMETRKNSEFRSKEDLVSYHFPPGKQIEESYLDFFDNESLRLELEREKTKDPSYSAEKVEKARAVQALKYILNYYEFMAVGIRRNELDENILYESIGISVTGVHWRAQKYISYWKEKKGPLVYCDLDALCEKWVIRLDRDSMSKKHASNTKPKSAA